MKVLISGAGIAGLAAAHAFSRAGWEVVVLERARSLRTGGYMIDFFGPGYDAAEALGLLPALRARSYAVERIDFVDAAGRGVSMIDYRLARKGAGGKLFPILRGDIEAVLHEQLPASVQLRWGTVLTAVEDNTSGVTVGLSDGATEHADLLVGADGIHSELRTRRFGPEANYLRYLGFHTAAYFFQSDAVAGRIGGNVQLMTVPNRLMGLYGLPDGRIASFFVWREPAATRPSDAGAALRRAFDGSGWLVPQTLEAMPPPEEIYYDLVAQVEMPAWHSGRAVLVGDSAYAVSLLAGQGASLAIAGAEALGRIVGQRRDLPQALSDYDAQLRPTILEKQKSGRRTADWFVPPTRFHIGLRNVALNAVNSPLLSRVLGRFLSLSAKGVAPASH